MEIDNRVGSALRRLAIEEEITRQKGILNRLNHKDFAQVRRAVHYIEALRDELETLEDLEALEAEGISGAFVNF